MSITFSSIRGTREVEIIRFPSGEVCPKVPPLGGCKEILISWYYESMDELFAVMQMLDYYNLNGNPYIHLYVPFLPCARQDRVQEVDGLIMPNSAKTILQTLRTYSLASLTVDDLHSDLNSTHSKVISNSQFSLLEPLLPASLDKNNTIIVIPDEGAVRKMQPWVDAGYKVLTCSKTRDVNGNLSGFRPLRIVFSSTQDTDWSSVDSDFYENNHFFIVDDICDGGGTFLGLNEAIRQSLQGEYGIFDREIGSMNLLVTHGLFTKGMSELEHKFDTVISRHTYNLKSLQGIK